MKIYCTSDGRTAYAVAAKSRAAALRAFQSTKAMARETYGHLRDYGMEWDIGQVEGTDIIAASPGKVFSSDTRWKRDKWAPL